MADLVEPLRSQRAVTNESHASTTSNEGIARKLFESRKMSRALSKWAIDSVSAPTGASYSSGAAVLYAMNMVLGTGPLTLPFAFAKAGFLLSAGFLAVCATLGYITATYLIETLALGNGVLFEQAKDKLIESDAVDEAGELSQGVSVKALSPKEKLAVKESIRSIDRIERPEKVFKIRERIELGMMGKRMLPGPLSALLYCFLFLYTFGTLCVYAVTIVTTLGTFFPTVANMQGGHYILVAVTVCCLIPLCFADMQKLKSLQAVILGCRALAIIGFLSVSCFEISKKGFEKSKEEIPPMVQVDGLPALFANAVLSFMLHHSLPGVLAPLEDQRDGPRVIRRAYGIAYFIYLALGYTALLAFGSGVKELYNLNFDHYGIIGQLLCGYPLLIFAIYPIVAITLRNNVLAALNLPAVSADNANSPSSLGSTLAVVLLPAAVACITNNVQAIVSIFAGYFGLSLMLVFPVMLVSWGRHVLKLDPDEFQHFHLKTACGSKVIRFVVVVFWAGAITFNTYRLFFAAPPAQHK